MINKNIAIKLIFFSIFALISLFTFFALSLFKFSTSPFEVAEKGVVINVLSGDSAKNIAYELNNKMVIKKPRFFYLLSRLYGLDTKLQVGEYLITNKMNPKQLLHNISNGKVVQYYFTVIEGWNLDDLISSLHKEEKISKTNNLKEKISAKLNISNRNLEGLFLPDTYFYTANTKDIDFLIRINKKLQEFLIKEWPSRDLNSPLNTPYDVITLASIVEKETGLIQEMPKIAGVFLQRLKDNMKLQADPTIVYIKGKNFKGNISQQDLKIDSPYNTYLYKGLPPTPIALPGKNAIRAVLNPEKTEFLYFVADGKGGHVFSKTLEEHNNAVQEYRKYMEYIKSKKDDLTSS